MNHTWMKLLRHHTLFSVARWGVSRSITQAVLKFGVGRAALGVATTGVTGITIKSQIDERRTYIDRDTISAKDELMWVNAAAKPIWDHLNAGIQRFIVDEVEPVLRQSVPGVGRFLRFRKLTLGDTAPQLGPIVVSKAHDNKSLDLSIEFKFEGDLAVEFSTGVASIEVVDLKISGMVQVSMQPLVDALNPVGGIRISCLDRPRIDLKINAPGVPVANLYDFVREAVDDAIAGSVVVPNGIAVPIDTAGGPCTDEAHLAHPVPYGILRVTLENISSTSGTSGAHAAYAFVQVGAAHWHTPTAKASNMDSAHGFVQWTSMNVQDFMVFSPKQNVEFRVFRENTWQLHKILGRACVSVGDLVGGAFQEIPLTAVDGTDSGIVMALRTDWFTVSEAPPAEPPPPKELAPCPEVVTHKKSKLHGVHKPLSTTTAGCGDAEVLVSADIRQVTGLQPKKASHYTVRVAVGGNMQESIDGFAPYQVQDGIEDEAFVQLARNLAPHLALVDLARALEVTVNNAKKISSLVVGSAQGEMKAESQDSKLMACCQRARAESRQMAAIQNPQFNQIFHIASPGAAALKIELVRHDEGKQNDYVVASSTHSLECVALQGGTLTGPFRLPLEEGGACELQGSIRLRHLERLDASKSSLREKQSE